MSEVGKMKTWERILYNPEYDRGCAPVPAPVPNQQPATKSEMLKRRCNSKYMSNAIALELSRLNSPLKFKYLKTLSCGLEVRQEGNELTSRYCGCRWCITCNRIRTSKLLQKYGEIVECLKDTHFVTLTVRNIAPDVVNLKMYQREMYKHHRKVQDFLRKYGITLKGVRKYEAIPDKDLKGLRPHFHWLIDGTITEKQLLQVWRNQKLPMEVYNKQLALVRAGKLTLGYMKGEMLIQLWLKRHEGISDRKGQHVVKATEGTQKELFKYTTKVVVKTRRDENSVPLKLLDIIYQATAKVRTIAITGFVTVQPRKPDIKFSIDYRHVNKMVSIFCPQSYKHNGPVKVNTEVAKQIKRISNYNRKYMEYLCYKEFTEIMEQPIEEQLNVQSYPDLQTQSTVFAWREDNWYCVTTGQPLTVWQPTKKTALFLEAFYYD